MKLYQFPTAFQEVYATIDEQDGEITDALAGLLDSLEMELADKVDACCKLIKQLGADAEAATAEAQRIADLASSRKAKAAWLKDYLQANLEALKMQKFETTLFKVRVQKNSAPSITWTLDIDKLPAEFAKVETKPNLKAAGEVFKDTGELPEGFIVKHGSHLRIT